MTREQAIKIISYHKILVDKDTSGLLNKQLEYQAIDMAIKALEQEPKIGYWINTCEYVYRAIDCIECSCCHHKSLEEGNYCPNCGAKMEGGRQWG